MFGFLNKENKCFSRNKELEKIFDILGSLTVDKNVRDDFLYKFNHLKSYRNADIFMFARLYLDWEDYLLTKHTLGSSDLLTTNTIRKKVSLSTNLHSIDIAFSLIFEKEKLQFAYLSELFLYFISKYIIDNLGIETLININETVAINNISKKISINKEGFDFVEFNEEISNSPEYGIQQTVALFKIFFEIFSERIEVSFGKDITKTLFNDVYAKLHKIYNSDLISKILVVIPERVLNLDEWLSMLSKSELEERVREKTTELEDIASSLEKKVEDRTQELRVAYNELKELDKRKSEFIFLVGHQMRTPLVAVKWALSMLKSGDAGEITPEQKKIVENAYAANESMNNVVNEILAADDIMNNKSNYSIIKADVIPIIEKVIGNMTDIANQRGINFETRFLSSSIAMVDPDKFSQVLSAIIDNAVRYSSPQSKVFVEYLDNVDGVSIVIRDTGIGISEDVKNRIGERFFRADNALRQNTYGSGLGLYIAKRTIEAFGGELIIEGKEGKGTTVTIILKK